MKRQTIIIGISILLVFILCSLSYQPIIAETPIETISIAKKSKVSDLDVDEIKELHIKLLELKFESKDDCGCNDESSRWGFPIVCAVLGMFLLIIMILVISMNQNQFLDLLEFVMSIGNSLNCW